MKEIKHNSSIFFQNGCRYMELNDFQNAIDEFEKLISFAPSVEAIQKN